MYSPVTRLLTILDLLQARPNITASELAERLEVNTRSVRRYITMLQDLGIPVEAERGRYGGYRLRPGYKLPPLMWSEEEALAVTLGLNAARKLGLARTFPTVEGALAKVERVLPLTLRERVQAVQEMVTLSLPTPETSEAPYLAELSAAAQSGQRVRLVYSRNKEERTERLFDCYGLLYRDGRWYVIGYCNLRSETRIFRLDRVESVELLDEYFERPADFDSLSYAIQSFAAIPSRWLVEVRIEAAMERIRLAFPPEFATLEETSAGVLLRAYHDDLECMAAMLAGSGCRFHIVQPPELRDALRKLAEELRQTADE